ncbi:MULTISPECIES: alpha/beta hydrolase [Pseudomonas]|uniref:alpha/beta hydrolase n=1 Tax=Pseudomonas TaxID=286 RepID=UPI0012430954|nr:MULTISPECIES: alpha/beta hydrolase [Pseudomonas]MBP5944128.1 alpha/beta hydrolase [Pseudomonas sp. P9(2020)]MBP5956246.1 alpha/beta hydrolase [Pseudomonas anatoliensis]MBZ9562843.1 alpha/beta hydrolase [Pseudomonas sp. P116]VVO91230.1 2-succinyl-6-hydroxy-2, 4-cyclohexadiene-1-carboxylate synthase [Pseudomonas fluorescens]
MSATFDPDQLRASLKPLAEWQPLSEEAKAYQRFYKTDFPERDVWRGMGRFDVDGYELVSHCWWPEKVKGTLFLLHGFYDHTGLYRHLIEWALDQDFAVIACDLPGHGLSSGARASIRDFSEYQDALQALFVEANSIALPQPWHLCGQSTGGAIVVDHVLNHGESSPAQGQVILLSPLVRPRAWGWSQLSYYLLRPFVRGIARRFSENSNDPDFLPFLLADPLQPKRLPTAWVGALSRWINRVEFAKKSPRRPLIIQGQADMTVDWQHNLQVLKLKFDRPQILLLPEARHHLANETADMREEYFEFLSKRIRGRNL